jgi:hypothetical protein
MYAFARCLGMSDDAPRDITSLDDYINDKLMGEWTLLEQALGFCKQPDPEQ